MNRKQFLALLCGIPFVGKLMAKPKPSNPMKWGQINTLNGVYPPKAGTITRKFGVTIVGL